MKNISEQTNKELLFGLPETSVGIDIASLTDLQLACYAEYCRRNMEFHYIDTYEGAMKKKIIPELIKRIENKY